MLGTSLFFFSVIFFFFRSYRGTAVAAVARQGREPNFVNSLHRAVRKQLHDQAGAADRVAVRVVRAGADRLSRVDHVAALALPAATGCVARAVAGGQPGRKDRRVCWRDQPRNAGGVDLNHAALGRVRGPQNLAARFRHLKHVDPGGNGYICEGSKKEPGRRNIKKSVGSKALFFSSTDKLCPSLSGALLPFVTLK